MPGFILDFLLLVLVTISTITAHRSGLTEEEIQMLKYPDQIIFPSSDNEPSAPNYYIHKPKPTVSSAFEPPPGKLGKTCLRYNGVSGICVHYSECKVLIHYLLTMYSERIIQCGSPSLICCPEVVQPSRGNSIGTVKPGGTLKPSVATPARISNSNNTSTPTNPVVKNDQGLKVTSTNSKPVENTKISSQPLSVLEPDAGFDFTDEEAQNLCGILPDKFNKLREGEVNIWPWIVSIGHRYENGTTEWSCLGSLITTEYILSSSFCFQRSPNIVAIGTALLGRMTTNPGETNSYEIRSLASIFTHEKFQSPYMYKNIGLGRLSSPIHVTRNIIPVCFPFLAGVLDIVQFVGVKGKTIAFDLNAANIKSSITLHAEEYRVLNNSQCSRVFEVQKSQTIKRFPFGIRSENMCGLNRNTSACQAPGAPLVIFDSASESFVQIGISSGDPTCSELKRAVVTFARLNSFSSWVRDRVGQLPNPPPCYF